MLTLDSHLEEQSTDHGGTTWRRSSRSGLARSQLISLGHRAESSEPSSSSSTPLHLILSQPDRRPHRLCTLRLSARCRRTRHPRGVRPLFCNILQPGQRRCAEFRSEVSASELHAHAQEHVFPLRGRAEGGSGCGARGELVPRHQQARAEMGELRQGRVLCE